MLSGLTETPGRRPRPPAKMRRRTSLAPSKSSANSMGTTTPITSSPPPAYGSTYELPESQALPDTLLGSPMPTTFRLMGGYRLSPTGEEDAEQRMNKQARDELAELLGKAEDLIKERANELGLTSAVVKNLYDNNVALKTKHEALLARLPVSPSTSNSSPDNLSRIISRNNSLSYSTSDSILNSIYATPPPQHPPLYRGHARRVSMSNADISLLADQNAELMQKLEQLESESSSADQAGRRELRRLEKEITGLREALEKTQAKSEELEQKTKGLDKGIDKVVEDAWKRKKEREQRMKALRNAGRPGGGYETNEEHHVFRDFAPKGPMLGSFAFSKSLNDIPDFDDEDQTLTNDSNVFVQPELQIITQLLHKVQELEATNGRILQQQKETVNQLHAVQRDTEHITKVYECLADPHEVELELEQEELAIDQENDAMKFGSFKRRIESQLSERDTHPDKTHGRGKARKSVVGLFDDPNAQDSSPAKHRSSSQNFSSWNDNRHRNSYSISSAGLASPALAGLRSFNSPQQDLLAELSPVSTRQTLESELGRCFGNEGWEMQREKYHLRAHSFSNLSQFSVPLSPSPLPGAFPSQLDLPAIVEPHEQHTPPSGPQQPPRLSLEPPTPVKGLGAEGEVPQLHLEANKSPRHQFISQRIRERKARWEDGRFGSLSSVSSSVWDDSPEKHRPEPVFVPPRAGHSTGSIPRRISTAVDSLVYQFDGRAQSPASESGYEDGDEGEESFDEETDGYVEDNEEGDEDDEASVMARTPQLAKHNALQLHQVDEEESVQSKKGGAASEGRGASKWGSVLLELWLWLQFTVIIFVFLCAMAKRGPKSVLADAEHKTRTRKVSMPAKRF